MSESAARPLLKVRGLRKSFGDRLVLVDVDLDVHAGELVTLLGANGSGKSTALRCVVGLAEPDDGSITVDGRTLSAAGRHQAAAMVFQKIHLVTRRSALDNVCAGALGRVPWSRSWSPMVFPRDLREEAMACLDRVGLADRAHDRASRLSGGQQQRVAVARALCQRARVLLADEPVSALDPAAAQQVMELLRSLADEDGIAVAAVLHQPHLAKRHADRIVGLLHGKVAWNTSAAMLDRSAIDSLYAPDRRVEVAA